MEACAYKSSSSINHSFHSLLQIHLHLSYHSLYPFCTSSKMIPNTRNKPKLPLYHIRSVQNFSETHCCNRGKEKKEGKKLKIVSLSSHHLILYSSIFCTIKAHQYRRVMSMLVSLQVVNFSYAHDDLKAYDKISSLVLGVGKTNLNRSNRTKLLISVLFGSICRR